MRYKENQTKRDARCAVASMLMHEETTRERMAKGIIKTFKAVKDESITDTMLAEKIIDCMVDVLWGEFDDDEDDITEKD